MIGKSKYLKTVPFKSAATNGIVPQSLFRPMLIAIQFDNKLSFKADEIHDVRPDRLLSPKFEFMKTPATKRAPQLTLGNGLLTS